MNIPIRNPLVAPAAACWSAARRRYCRIRYRRIDAGPGVLTTGRIKLDCCIFDHGCNNALPRERHLARGPAATGPVHPGRNVGTATRAIMTKGSQISADSVAGAGSAVRGTVPAGAVVIGNPAKVARTFNDAARTIPRPGPSSGPAGSIPIPQTPGRPR